jgi:Ca2+-dependent lipid-binding protein
MSHIFSIYVVSATNLPKMDVGLGKIDPYAVLGSSKSCKTKVVKKEYNPTWNERVDGIISDLNVPVKVSLSSFYLFFCLFPAHG